METYDKLNISKPKDKKSEGVPSLNIKVGFFESLDDPKIKDLDSFLESYRKYFLKIAKQELWPYGINNLESEAEDITNNFAIKLIESDVLSKYKRKRDATPITWITRVLINFIRDEMRKRSRVKRIKMVQSLENDNGRTPFVSREESILDELIAHETDETLEQRIEKLRKYIESLPKKYKVSIQARLEGLSYEEIADKAQIPVGTVKSAISRAKALLHKKFENEINNKKN